MEKDTTRYSSWTNFKSLHLRSFCVIFGCHLSSCPWQDFYMSKMYFRFYLFLKKGLSFHLNTFDFPLARKRSCLMVFWEVGLWMLSMYLDIPLLHVSTIEKWAWSFIKTNLNPFHLKTMLFAKFARNLPIGSREKDF